MLLKENCFLDQIYAPNKKKATILNGQLVLDNLTVQENVHHLAKGPRLSDQHRLKPNPILNTEPI